MTASGCFRLARGGGVVRSAFPTRLQPHTFTPHSHTWPCKSLQMVMYYTNRLSVQCPWKTCLQIRQSQHSLAQPAVFVLGTHKSSSALLLFMLLYIHFHYSNNCFWIRRFAIAKGKIIITIMKFILRTRSSKLHVGHRIKEYQCLNPHQALLWSTLLSSLPHTVCHTQKLPVHWALKGAWLPSGQPRPLHTSKGY